MTDKDHMSAEERAEAAYKGMWELTMSQFLVPDHLHAARVERLAAAIKAAENDALERAAANAESSSCEEFDDAWIIARSIRPLKSENTP